MHQEKRHNWLRSGSYTLSTNILNLIFNFGSFYLLVRILDKEHFGVWALFVTTSTIFEMARNGLVQNALIKFLSSGTKEESPEILSASFSLGAIVMAACIAINIGIAGFLAKVWHYPALTTMFYTYSIVYLLQGILSQFQWIEQANLRFRGIFISNALKQGGFFFYVLACFVFHIQVTLISLIYIQALMAFLAMLTEYFFIREYLFFKFDINRGWIKKLFNYGKYVFGTSISTILANTINQMMLGAMLSANAAGIFNVAARITNLADLPVLALSSVIFPQSARRFESQGASAGRDLYEKSVGAILALTIPPLIIFFLFPTFIVHIIAGNIYDESAPVIKITAVACLFNPFAVLFGTILDSIGKQKINFVLVIFFALSKLLLNYFLIKQAGIMGAVYATLIVDAIFFVVMQIILRKKLHVNLINIFRYAGRFYPEFIKKYVR